MLEIKNRTNGWDERDYKLWSDVKTLPSYGLIAFEDKMISMKQVLALLEKHADARFNKEHQNG
jgi:hypothetical protein